MKASGEQYDDRIVEVHWDPFVSGWRMMRFRNDNPNGNHKTVVDNIITSIADGVEKETVSEEAFTRRYFPYAVQCTSFYLVQTIYVRHGKLVKGLLLKIKRHLRVLLLLP